jgi:hypothetical protein
MQEQQKETGKILGQFFADDTKLREKAKEEEKGYQIRDEVRKAKIKKDIKQFPKEDQQRLRLFFKEHEAELLKRQKERKKIDS